MDTHILYIIARCLVALMFLMSAVGKLGGRKESLAMMQAHHIPLAPLGLFGSAALELVATVCLTFGLIVVPLTWILVLYVLAATVAFPVQDIVTNKGRSQALQLLGSNLAIIGGLIALIACATAKL